MSGYRVSGGSEAAGLWRPRLWRPPYVGATAVDPNNTVTGGGTSTGTNPIVIPIPTTTKLNQIVLVCWGARGTGVLIPAVVVSGSGAPVTAAGQGSGFSAPVPGASPAANIAGGQKRAILAALGYDTVTVTPGSGALSTCALVFLMGTSSDSSQVAFLPTSGTRPYGGQNMAGITGAFSPANIAAMTAIGDVTMTTSTSSSGGVTAIGGAGLTMAGAKATFVNPATSSLTATTSGSHVYGMQAIVYKSS